MDNGKNNWIYWTLGGLALTSLGVGAFLFFRNKNKGEEKKADTSTQQQTQTQTQNQSQYQGNNTNESAKQETNYPEAETYFGSKEQGNAFRRWVIAKDPNFAKEIDLSKSGDYNNSYIKKAYAKYGFDFQNVNKDFLKSLTTYVIINNAWKRGENGDAYFESGDANNGARFTLDGNGRLFVEGRKNGSLGSKWQSGGWFISGDKIILLFKNKEYQATPSNIQNQAVWEIWSKAGLWSGSAFTPFVDFMNMTESANRIDGSVANDYQDEIL